MESDLRSRRHLVQLVDLARSLPHDTEEVSRELYHLFLVSRFEQGVAANDLLRLGERAVGDHDLSAGAFVHADARRAEIDALGCDQPPRFHALFDELAHGGHFGLRRGAVRGFVRKNADEAHVCLSSWISVALASNYRRMAGQQIDMTQKVFRSN